MDVLSIAANLYYYVYEFFRSPDYSVTRAYIYYKCDSVTDTELTDPWITEAKYWSKVEDGGYYMDITSQFRASRGKYLQELLDSKPSNVTDMLYIISYKWANKKYKYASRAPAVVWPPIENSGEMKFRLPVHSAWACSKDGQSCTFSAYVDSCPIHFSPCVPYCYVSWSSLKPNSYQWSCRHFQWPFCL